MFSGRSTRSICKRGRMARRATRSWTLPCAPARPGVRPASPLCGNGRTDRQSQGGWRTEFVWWQRASWSRTLCWTGVSTLPCTVESLLPQLSATAGLGEKHFMESFIDGDLAANNGGWQWTASTGTDPQPYFVSAHRPQQSHLQDLRRDCAKSFSESSIPSLNPKSVTPMAIISGTGSPSSRISRARRSMTRITTCPRTSSRNWVTPSQSSITRWRGRGLCSDTRMSGRRKKARSRPEFLVVDTAVASRCSLSSLCCTSRQHDCALNWACCCACRKARNVATG